MSTPARVYGRSHHSESIVVTTESTMSGAARVLTLTGPMGQSEFSMSMTCLARTPCGVLVSIRTPAPALAGGAGAGAQLLARAATVAIAVGSANALRRTRRALRLRAGPRNVQHNLELE